MRRAAPDNIENEVRSIIAQLLLIDEGEVTLSSTLKELGADSIDEVEILMGIEDKYEILIGDDAADKLLNVADIMEYVRKATGK
jgi:acyl carrier protein